MRARAAELRAALPAGARLLYSLKANPLPPVVRAVRTAGCGAEISSPGELDAAVAAGFDPADLLCTGPGKAARELAAAVDRGVSSFSCESAAELERLARAGRDHRPRILLRLQPPGGPASGLSMTQGRQFGFEPEEAVRVCRTAGDDWAPDGFHVYLGSQLDGTDALLAAFTHAAEVIGRVCEATGVAPSAIGLGGGFPWPYAARGAGRALTGLREGLELLLAGEPLSSVPEVWFESGRRLTASCGRLLTTVLDVKERAGGVVVVVDAGIDALGGMAGLGRVLRPAAEPENLSAAGRSREPVTADVVGPLCTPLDRLAVRTAIARPEPGEVLCVPNVGAYGLTASLTSFLSRPSPPELVVDGDEFTGLWQLTTRTAPAVLPGTGPCGGPGAA
ncbi:type III PLP-dependent enzyme [Streptomyces sp. F63]|nr:type III PLP-dependent enzyme [Streptomyces sp. F63]